jgi:hypothetical protein
MCDKIKLSFLDRCSLDAVTGGTGNLLDGRDAETLYNALMDKRNSGDPRVSGTGIATAGGPHATVSATVVCESVGLRNMKWWCNLENKE